MSSLEFTGERYIPGCGGAQIAYEHLHRYVYASRWAEGKIVLDVASGEGYGAALLASCARAVWAVELDPEAVRHARAQSAARNLLFVRANAARLPFREGVAGLVVAMEILEHEADQEALVGELARVAARDGVVLISTPNRAAYSDARGYVNPFHVRELYRNEFMALVARHFRHVSLLTQHVRAGSLILPEDACRDEEIRTEPRPAPGIAATDPMYFLAVCSHEAPARQPARSAYLDPSDQLLSEWEAKLASSQGEIAKLNGEIESLGRWGSELESRIGERDATIAHLLGEVEIRERIIADLHQEQDLSRKRHEDLRQEMASEVAKRDGVIVTLQGEFEGRTRWVAELQKEIARRDGQLVDANREIDRISEELARIRRSLVYRALARVKLLPR